jgi:hypothetical protein
MYKQKHWFIMIYDRDRLSPCVLYAFSRSSNILLTHYNAVGTQDLFSIS